MAISHIGTPSSAEAGSTLPGSADSSARRNRRYFSDKREVLFPAGDEFASLFVAGLADAPESASPGRA